MSTMAGPEWTQPGLPWDADRLEHGAEVLVRPPGPVAAENMPQPAVRSQERLYCKHTTSGAHEPP